MQSMPKYVLPEGGGRGSVGDISDGGIPPRHRPGQHMNFSPYASRMGSSMENLGGFIAAGRNREGADGSGNSSEEEGQLASRVFRRTAGRFYFLRGANV